jgi:hypothetical protein
MLMRLRASTPDSAVAIYQVPSLTSTDDDPLANPLNHLANGRIKFHTSFPYTKVIDERVINLPLPYREGNGYVHRVSYDLFAHGRPGIPWVLGSFRIGAYDVSATGSVPVQNAIDATSPWKRILSLGANSTHVQIFEYTVCPSRSSHAQFSAITIPITVWITEELL